MSRRRVSRRRVSRYMAGLPQTSLEQTFLNEGGGGCGGSGRASRCPGCSKCIRGGVVRRSGRTSKPTLKAKALGNKRSTVRGGVSKRPR